MERFGGQLEDHIMTAKLQTGFPGVAVPQVRREKMKRFTEAVRRGDIVLYSIAGAVLAFMILLTLCDVILRNLGHPITGSMEIIQYGGSIVFGFSIPYATWMGAQVLVDLVTQKLSPRGQKRIQIVTRAVGIVIFLFIAYNFFVYALDVRRTGEVTASFKIPYYPFCFAISLSFLFHSLTILCDFVNTLKGEKP
ncbi:MAG: TRAP transporter small permease [Desulfobacteraceae bacterium]|nr:MAG: TRAP transporter small permease [Desulfobacteraceae bacterium]